MFIGLYLMESAMKFNFSALVASLVTVTFVASTALAEPVKYYPTHVTLSPIQIAKILKGASFKPSHKMRGVRLVGDAPDTPLAIQVPVAAISSDVSSNEMPAALAMPIPFAFNSSQLSPEATAPLDQIADGLKLVQSGGATTFVIEGHTDGVGGDQYNLRLSQKRAAAVKRYLVKTHGIQSASLKAVGKGKAEPLNAANPRAEENRRVEFKVG
jgi:outer membrane protein OmpA-like peptidoglycan-associated protein